jgi:hypothetical protein
MTQDQKRQLIGCAIMFGSISALFWSGFHFKIFGQRIRLDGPSLGFFGCLAIGSFGIGFTASGIRAGLKSVGMFMLLAGGALAVGVMQGHYH